jgi:hypothetical protein
MPVVIRFMGAQDPKPKPQGGTPKVKTEKKHTPKSRLNQGESPEAGKPAKIKPDTAYEMTEGRMTAYGGLFGLVKFLDLIGFREVFVEYYQSPGRKPELGCYRMVLGFLILLFVGFARVGHLEYLRRDPMVCGILEVEILPAVSTFWRYLRSLWWPQSQALLKISAVLRARVWQACRLGHTSISVNIDTTVSTVYGQIEGSRKGHNPQHRGKKGLRPVLLFLEETREYLCGAQRSGKTMRDEEGAQLLREMKQYLPAQIRRVLVRGDAEFIGAQTIQACRDCGYDYIFGNRSATPHFIQRRWYRHGAHQYNGSLYQPRGWPEGQRFVAMRIREEERGDRQLKLYEGDYLYRIFVTSLKGKPHRVIARYDGRASVENAIKEAQQEGLLAIPSKRFWSNHAFFQLVMLAYNLWRWMKLLAIAQGKEGKPLKVIAWEGVDHTIRIARLKMLFLPAKITTPQHRTTINYSNHDARAAELVDFLKYLDRRRRKKIPWQEDASLDRYKKAS